MSKHGRGQIADGCVEVDAVEQIARRNRKSKGIFTIARTRVLAVVLALSGTMATLHTLIDISLADSHIHICDELVLAKAAVRFIRVDISSPGKVERHYSG